MDRIAYLKDELQKARESLDAKIAIGDYFTIGDAEAKYNGIARELSWLQSIDIALVIPHSWGTWSEQYGRVSLSLIFPAVVVYTPFQEALTLPDGIIHWSYDLRYFTQDFPPARMMADKFTRDYIDKNTALWDWIESVTITNELLRYLHPDKVNHLLVMPTIEGDRSAGLYVWRLHERRDLNDIDTMVDWMLEADSKTVPFISLSKDRAGENWDKVIRLIARAMINHTWSIDWTPFKP